MLYFTTAIAILGDQRVITISVGAASILITNAVFSYNFLTKIVNC